jgi:hypothetical protein
MEGRKAELLQRIESDREVLLDFFRRFIRCPSPNPPGDTREAAAHIRQFDRLTRYPECGHRREDRERDVQHHDERAAPIPQKQEHHQAGEHDAERALEEQAPDGPRDVRGLIELVADLDVVRQNGLETRQVGFDGLDDRECGGIRSFGHGDVYGAASVHERVTGLNVGAVFDRADVAYEDRLRPLRADRNVVQAFDIPDNGVDRYSRP